MVQRVGVIGGGQLAWMMAAGARKLGIDLVVQTPKPTDPAAAIASELVLADIDDAAATARLADLSDVVTFENEFIDIAALRSLEPQVQFYPRLDALQPLVNKADQRVCFRQLGLPTPQFVEVDQESQIDWDALQYPVVLKTCRLGYDGQGTAIVQDRANLETVVRRWNQPILIEEFIPFERELAVMVARSRDGQIVTYPVVETQQADQVCRRVIVANDLDARVVDEVAAIAQTLLDALDYVGVMGIELFLTHEGKVLINETAPRTHNSGHYTLDACETSQFEQQLRAVCGLPLGAPDLTCAGAVMINLLGFETAESEYGDRRQQLAALPNAHVYWYGKTQSRPGRKLGHVTVLIDRAERAKSLEIAQQVEAIWYP